MYTEHNEMQTADAAGCVPGRSPSDEGLRRAAADPVPGKIPYQSAPRGRTKKGLTS